MEKFKVVSDLNRLLTTGESSDFILKSNEPENPQQFKVHKFVLSLRSPVLKEMFSACDSTPNKKTNEIVLPYNKKAVDIVVNYIYLEEIPSANNKTYPFESLIQAFLAADYLDLPFGSALAETIQILFKNIFKYADSYRSSESYDLQNSLEKYVNLVPIRSNPILSDIYAKFDLICVVNYETGIGTNISSNRYVPPVHRQSKIRLSDSPPDTGLRNITPTRLYRILQLPPQKFDCISNENYESCSNRYINYQNPTAHTYKSVFKIFVDWIKVNEKFTPQKPTDASKMTHPIPQKVRAIADFAFEKIKFENYSFEFVRDEIDCGLFTETQILSIYRSIKKSAA
ncbi:hypothetical protein HK098_002457 [Nowakowskiella sp. JEL0407]|nr:hypothetical protein HK098_002457 [Nowakowskiella sp. JEL0407]